MSMFGEESGEGRLDQHFMPNVRFQFDDDPDPYKRRKKNMKNALRVLKPKRSWFPPWGPKFNNPGQCCVTGIDLKPLGYEVQQGSSRSSNTSASGEWKYLDYRVFPRPHDWQSYSIHCHDRSNYWYAIAVIVLSWSPTDLLVVLKVAL